MHLLRIIVLLSTIATTLACDLENLSVGHITLTDANFHAFKKGNSLFLLALSDSKCITCCITESYLQSLKHVLDNKVLGSKRVRASDFTIVDYQNCEG
jgi:hypothetical protein